MEERHCEEPVEEDEPAAEGTMPAPVEDEKKNKGNEPTFSCRTNAEAKKTTNYFLDRFSIPINLNFQDTMVVVTL